MIYKYKVKITKCTIFMIMTSLLYNFERHFDLSAAVLTGNVAIGQRTNSLG